MSNNIQPGSDNQLFGDPNLGGPFGVLPPPKLDPSMKQFRPVALNQPFHMRDRMKMTDKPMLGMVFTAFPDVTLARCVGQAGFDFIFVDWEHTPFELQNLVEIIKNIQYAGEGNTACIVRSPNHDHSTVAWLYDAGVSGVIFPHTETVEEAKKAVSSARMPPKGGARSGPPNALLYGYNDGGGVIEVWDRAAVIIQIESEKGARNAEAMAAVEGVDCLMVGPGDLAMDIGCTLFEMYTNKRWLEAVGQVVAAAKKHKLACFMPGFTPAIKGILDMGFTMTTCSNDGLLLTSGMRKELNEAAEVMEAFKASRSQ